LGLGSNYATPWHFEEGEFMPRHKIIEKLKAIVNNPEAMARLKQAQKTAQEANRRLREAGMLKPGWREIVYTI
jgi:hypothetical protein